VLGVEAEGGFLGGGLGFVLGDFSLSSAWVRRMPTGLLTPNSSMVTPYITSARAMVRLEWVTMMNWELSMK